MSITAERILKAWADMYDAIAEHRAIYRDDHTSPQRLEFRAKALQESHRAYAKLLAEAAREVVAAEYWGPGGGEISPAARAEGTGGRSSPLTESGVRRIVREELASKNSWLIECRPDSGEADV